MEDVIIGEARKLLYETKIKETLADLIHQDLTHPVRLGCIPDKMEKTIVKLSVLLRDYYTNHNWGVNTQGDLLQLVIDTVSEGSPFYTSLTLAAATNKELNDNRSIKEFFGFLPIRPKKTYKEEIQLLKKIYTQGTMVAGVPSDVVLGDRVYPDNPYRLKWLGQSPVTFERNDELVYSVNTLIPPLQCSQYLVVIDHRYLEIWRCDCQTGVGTKRLHRFTSTESHTAALLLRALFWFEFVRSQTKPVFEPKPTTVTTDDLGATRNAHAHSGPTETEGILDSKPTKKYPRKLIWKRKR